MVVTGGPDGGGTRNAAAADVTSTPGAAIDDVVGWMVGGVTIATVFESSGCDGVVNSAPAGVGRAVVTGPRHDSATDWAGLTMW